MTKLDSCCSCGGERFEPMFIKAWEEPFARRYEPTDPPQSTEVSAFTLQRCVQCGLVFVNPMPDETSLHALYEEDFYAGGLRANAVLRWGGYANQYTGSRKAVTLKKNRARIQSFEKVWRRAVITQPRGNSLEKGKFLDIGCGIGMLLDAARELGWDVYGQEISDYSYRYAMTELDLPVFKGPLEEAQFPSNEFDMVTMIGVLEHVRKPREMLNEAWRVLKPGGMLVIEVPNDLECYRHRFFKRVWWIMPPVHLFYFTRRTLTMLLTDVRFEVEKIETKPFSTIFDDFSAVWAYEYEHSEHTLGAALLRLARGSKEGQLPQGNITSVETTVPRCVIIKNMLKQAAKKVIRVSFRPLDLCLELLNVHSEILAYARKPRR